eukprot:9847790-Heterocapsa_arctica.AAC.1
MLQYLLAGRCHFDRQHLALSAACDAGRFGNRECLLTAIGTPDNRAMWAPPVAPPQTGNPDTAPTNSTCFLDF